MFSKFTLGLSAIMIVVTFSAISPHSASADSYKKSQAMGNSSIIGMNGIRAQKKKPGKTSGSKPGSAYNYHKKAKKSESVISMNGKMAQK